MSPCPVIWLIISIFLSTAHGFHPAPRGSPVQLGAFFRLSRARGTPILRVAGFDEWQEKVDYLGRPCWVNFFSGEARDSAPDVAGAGAMLVDATCLSPNSGLSEGTNAVVREIEEALCSFDERLSAGRKAQGHGGGAIAMRASDLPSGLTYGEFNLHFFLELVSRAVSFRRGENGSGDFYPEMCTFPAPDLKFMDVGSGCGRLVFAAAMIKKFQVNYGIEIVSSLHAMATAAHPALINGSSATGNITLRVDILHVSNGVSLLVFRRASCRLTGYQL